MDQHLTGDQLRGYESGAMAASALLLVDRHLADCEICRRQLRESLPAPRLPELVQQMGEPIHLTYEQMAGSLDRSLETPVSEWVEQHVAICRRCARELAELHSFDDRMQSELQVRAQVRASERTEHWPARMRAALAHYMAAPQRLSFAAAGAALMLLGFFSLLQAAPAATGRNPAALAKVSDLVFFSSTPLHPQLFYGGWVVAACGAAVLLYGLLKR